jgi:hypothetical protein
MAHISILNQKVGICIHREITCNNRTFVNKFEFPSSSKMKTALLLTVFTLIFITNLCLSQVVWTSSPIQDSLSKQSSMIWKQKTDSGKLTANDLFFANFESMLETRGSELVPFDSIFGITRVANDDGKFRIFTWNVPLSDGSNKYFGFIQITHDNSIVIPLISVNYDQSNFTFASYTPQSWYGALYYKLIQEKTGDKTIYTLLGWDGFSSESNRKIIEIVSVENGNVVFGLSVFKTDQGIKSRIVLEYAEKSNMTLRYDYQAINVQKGKKIKKENTWLIVMDRLIPMDPSLKGLLKYYVPAGDVYDGYIFRNGYWVLVEDVEVANKEKKLK